MAAAEGACLNHVSRESSDIKRLAKFYLEIFGFEQIESPNFVEFEVIWLKLSPNFYLHLINRNPETKLPEGPWSAASPVADPKHLPRGHHICFSVSNFDSFVQTLKEKGIETHETIQPDGKTKQVFFFDPDGNGLEVASRSNCVPSNLHVYSEYQPPPHTAEMSQEQPRWPQAEQEPIRYGDVFLVSGNLASKPIAPQDAAMMQTAEASVLGQTQKGGPAAVMQSAANRNERAGLVGHGDISDVAGEQGVTVVEIDVPVGRYVEPTPVQQTIPGGPVQAAITIGEALEATAQTAGNKPVDQSDAAAIQAAETRATGSNVVTPGGVAATAQSAATFNAGMTRDEDKIKLTDVLTGVTVKLPADKAATRQDAEGVIAAELRNNPNMTTHPGGVAASVAAAARLNEGVP
ncbi:hypothetical protein F0562_000331 [Nyssa sinensis]|uniref:VOC domain-containing protein n=1 Tax=Nyssa sinensis TaxID=561372 RepID=A0A5J5C3Z3_9ASTE|nr:hypothetical protein F0562_000331 [Nyssa sinensis]